MMKREVIRILVAAGIGVIVALVWAYRSDSVCWEMLLLPFYFVGTFYAGSVLFKLIGGVLKTYFSGQFTSLLMNPLWEPSCVSYSLCWDLALFLHLLGCMESGGVSIRL